MNDAQEPGSQPADPQPPVGAPGDADLPPQDRPDDQPDGSPWAPPPPGSGSGTPEPTRPLPGELLAPSLMPPLAPGSSPTPPGVPDLTVRRPRRAPAGWVWPLVAALALVVGLGGGLVGALVYDRVIDDDTPDGPGYAAGGLEDVDLEELPPLEAPGSVAAVAQAVLPSTVQILAEYDGDASGATGSGWVMDNDGHIVTNNHVVAEAAQDDGPIVVIDHERNRYEATVVGRSPVYDLAVLYVEDNENLKAATLGRSTRLRVGEPVVAIGSPLGLPDTVTLGIVSYLHRPVTTGSSAEGSSYIDAVQTDAAINPGNSGGPLVNLQGEVIGVSSAIATAGGGTIDRDAGNIGVGFAIPVEQVRVTADQILRTGEARYPIIGANLEPDARDGGGARIDSIEKDSPAEDAGLRSGDVVVGIDGEQVADGLSLIVAIRSRQPGQVIELEVERGGDTESLSVTLDSRVG